MADNNNAPEEEAPAEEGIEAPVEMHKGPEPIVVSREDRLELEVAQLKLMNVRGVLAQARMQIENLNDEERSLNEQNVLTLEKVAHKYGFDPRVTQLNQQTGLVTPRPPGHPSANPRR